MTSFMRLFAVLAAFNLAGLYPLCDAQTPQKMRLPVYLQTAESCVSTGITDVMVDARIAEFISGSASRWSDLVRLNGMMDCLSLNGFADFAERLEAAEARSGEEQLRKAQLAFLTLGKGSRRFDANTFVGLGETVQANYRTLIDREMLAVARGPNVEQVSASSLDWFAGVDIDRIVGATRVCSIDRMKPAGQVSGQPSPATEPLCAGGGRSGGGRPSAGSGSGGGSAGGKDRSGAAVPDVGGLRGCISDVLSNASPAHAICIGSQSGGPTAVAVGGFCDAAGMSPVAGLGDGRVASGGVGVGGNPASWTGRVSFDVAGKKVVVGQYKDKYGPKGARVCIGADCPGTTTVDDVRGAFAKDDMSEAEKAGLDAFQKGLEADKAEKAADSAGEAASKARADYNDLKSRTDEQRKSGLIKAEETYAEKTARQKAEGLEKTAEEKREEAKQKREEANEANKKDSEASRNNPTSLCEAHMENCSNRCSASEAEARIGGPLAGIVNTQCTAGRKPVSRTEGAMTPGQSSGPTGLVADMMACFGQDFSGPKLDTGFGAGQCKAMLCTNGAMSSASGESCACGSGAQDLGIDAAGRMAERCQQQILCEPGQPCGCVMPGGSTRPVPLGGKPEIFGVVVQLEEVGEPKLGLASDQRVLMPGTVLQNRQELRVAPNTSLQNRSIQRTIPSPRMGTRPVRPDLREAKEPGRSGADEPD